MWTGGSEALGAPQPCLSSLWLLSVAFLGCLTGCQILTVDIFGNIIEQCEAVLFRQASWNYFDVFLAATGMTDIIMRVSLAQTGQFCGICSEALWLVIWFVDIFGTLAHWHMFCPKGFRHSGSALFTWCGIQDVLPPALSNGSDVASKEPCLQLFTRTACSEFKTCQPPRSRFKTRWKFLAFSPCCASVGW